MNRVVILDLAVLQPILVKESRQGLPRMRNNIQVEHVEHAIIKLGNWDFAAEKNPWYFWAGLYFEHIFNAMKCLKLRRTTLKELRLKLSEVHHLSSTCRQICLKNVVILPPPGGCPFIVNGVALTTEYRTCFVPFSAAVRRLVVRMDLFWDALDSSLEPLNEEEISLIPQNISKLSAAARSELTDFCKR